MSAKKFKKTKSFKFIPKRCELCKYYFEFSQEVYGKTVPYTSCLNPRFGHSDAEPLEYCSAFVPFTST